ncbi:unnamed protein product [Sphagnum tenellum]
MLELRLCVGPSLGEMAVWEALHLQANAIILDMQNLWPRPLGGAKRKQRWLVPGRPRFMTCTMCRWVVPNTLRFGAMDAVVESNPLCSFPISPSFFFLFFSKLSSSFIYHVNAFSLVFFNNCKFL